jgi:hypothetical protein
MVEWIEQVIKNTTIANAASILGFLLTITGFTIAIVQIGLARSDSSKAQKQVASLRSDFRRRDILLDLSATISLASEVKSSQLQARWDGLPSRYSDLKGKIASVKAVCDEHSQSRKVLQYCIVTLGRIQTEIEDALSNNAVPQDIPSLNKGLNKAMDKLQFVLAEISAEIGR